MSIAVPDPREVAAHEWIDSCVTPGSRHLAHSLVSGILGAIDKAGDGSPFVGDAAHPGWQDYVATNLLDALQQVPDTGDWHGALRAWCARTMSGTISPNRR